MSDRVLLCYPVEYLKKKGLPFSSTGTCMKCGATLGCHESSPVGLPMVCFTCHEDTGDDHVMVTEGQIRALVQRTRHDRERIIKTIEAVMKKKVTIVEDVV